MAISKRLRFEILRRDNHACRYCGASAPDAKLTVDHIVPAALGGADDPSNLVAACVDCNGGKASSSPDAPIVADIDADAIRWGRAMSRAADTILAQYDQRQELRDQFLTRWNGWTYKDWRTGQQVNVELPGNWMASVDSVLAARLPIEILCECVDLAMGTKGVKDEFRYMCGIAWRKVRELQEIAAALIEDEETREHLADPLPLSECLDTRPIGKHARGESN